MKIKSTERVIYSKNPLVEVVCQIRFSPLLQLQEESPRSFQEQFCVTHYPILEITGEQNVSIRLDALRNENVEAKQSKVASIYHFYSPDKKWKLSVSSVFITLTCYEYERWEIFSAKFYEAVEAFFRIYPVKFCERVGLRYRDIIEREKLGLTQVPWKNLLHPYVTGFFAADDMIKGGLLDEENVISQVNQSVLKLEDCGLLLNIGLLFNPEDKTTAFMIDSDYHVENLIELTASNIETTCTSLHNNAGGFFRHCITPQLHAALDPQPAR